MKVCIIGWYGTETIGDRAILCGILQLLAESFGAVHVRLGSLNPFFSARTLKEDRSLWAELAGQDIALELFSSMHIRQLRRAVSASDLLLIGGGPLMDLREMHMLAYATKYAAASGVRSGVFGCGVGPLKGRRYVNALKDILACVDFAVFRDSISLSALPPLGVKGVARFESAVDPAAHCAMTYLEKGMCPPVREQIAINVRAMPADYPGGSEADRIDALTTDLVARVAAQYKDYSVLLTPHHYFWFGGDDRCFLNRIKFAVDADNVSVQNRPLSLRKTMDAFAASTFCVGMRFHAIVLMVLLCGRCRLLNYTGSSQGKIMGFLRDCDPSGFFNGSRAVSLKDTGIDDHLLLGIDQDDVFHVDKDIMDRHMAVYRDALGAEPPAQRRGA